MGQKTTESTKVLFIWDVPIELRHYLDIGLKEIENLELIYPKKANEEEYLRHALTADIIVGWRPSEELLESAKKLKLFINPGAGVQHHIDRFRKLNETREIILVNGHGNSYFTAQHAVALLLSLMNKVIPHHNWMTEGKWRTGDSDARSVPLRMRKVGLLGYGYVNMGVHKFLSGFNVEFLILKRTWHGAELIDNTLDLFPTRIKRYSPGDLHDFLKEIDILIVAIPQTEQTEGLIGEKELKLLGPDGFLVNMARGLIVDQDALYEALKSKTIAGAAIDVWYDYRSEPDSDGKKYPFTKPFHTLEYVVLSPHRGASPMNDLFRWDEVIENISRFAKGNMHFMNIVDLERGY